MPNHLKTLFARLSVFLLVMTLTSAMAIAQSPSTSNNDLAAELEQLRAKVSQLESALAAQHQARYGATADTPQGSMNNMSMSTDAADPSQDAMQMGDKKQMSGMGDKKMGMGMMSGGMGMGKMSNDYSGMGMLKGMGMMGRNPAMNSFMGGMTMSSALPGFAGASHLYHIGQTGFFLDHPKHITLTDDQQLKLNQIKEAALLATSTAERKIDEAEQELWTLTAEAQPEINKIEAKANEIGKLRAENRVAFIRSVGEAANVLNEQQRQTLVGMAASSDAATED
ncbi:Spy/CpxP family protein refolding chaperone [Novipirellula artificiosorum]|uniref:Periplasmic heavy metal sensor n=1 Tax=Novipirellula artificiosorum TaxID=2528016 RepID=A0A5C6DXA3_9BACT|nr:hypothetical protein [Novipirellula artificiosorum]TWU39449.1 hypothetical protein Poly41_22730 [Novipirellula artificiosorum]